MKVALVHYHLEPGGVTRVLENTVQSWKNSGKGPDQWVILSGRPYTGKILDHVRVVEGLDYATLTDSIDPKTLRLRMEDATRDALGQLPDLWHVHNHSLGKNPALTQAIAQLAKEESPMLLQPHDFAEDGRSGNFLNLGKSHEKAYPTGGQIHYAALNRRDQSFLQYVLKDHPSSVHLLANAVPSVTPSDLVKTRTSNSGIPDNLYLYPVRAVRRKNLGELALLAASHPEIHFANSLGPTNPSFRATYEDWKGFGKSLGLSLTYGLGEQTNESFPELVQQAASIINVSVAEGFGLGFLEPWSFGKSLCGRNIPDITSDFTQLGVNLENLYSNLWVERSLLDEECLRKKIKAALVNIYRQYQVTLPVDAFKRACDAIYQDERIDFGCLDEAMQKVIIQQVKTSQQLGSSLREQAELNILTREEIRRNQNSVRENFSASVYGIRVQQIYQKIIDSTQTTIEFADGQKMLEQFLSPERLNLLRA